MAVNEGIYKTQDVLAVAFRAFKHNDGYVKDTVRFSEPTNNTVFSNKDMVKFQMRPEFRPPDFKAFKTLQKIEVFRIKKKYDQICF